MTLRDYWLQSKSQAESSDDFPSSLHLTMFWGSIYFVWSFYPHFDSQFQYHKYGLRENTLAIWMSNWPSHIAEALEHLAPNQKPISTRIMPGSYHKICLQWFVTVPTVTPWILQTSQADVHIFASFPWTRTDWKSNRTPNHSRLFATEKYRVYEMS